MQDHPAAINSFTCPEEKGPISVTDHIYRKSGQIRVRALTNYALRRRGPLTTTACDHGAFMTTQGATHTPPPPPPQHQHTHTHTVLCARSWLISWKPRVGSACQDSGRPPSLPPFEPHNLFSWGHWLHGDWAACTSLAWPSHTHTHTHIAVCMSLSDLSETKGWFSLPRFNQATFPSTL